MICSKHNTPEGLSIEFLNVKPDEAFSYSIVLIKGIISNYNRRHGLATLRITDENYHRSIENAEIQTDGKFRVAVELTTGVNRFKFQHCCIANDISLVFNRPENPLYLLRVFYIICQNDDGHFQAPSTADNSVEVACEKIDLAMRLVQCLYAEMLAKNGFTRKAFEFVRCQPFNSRMSVDEARNWNEHQLWTYHAKEFLAHETDTHHKYKYFGILASTVCANGTVKGNAALGIGDVAVFGSGTLYAWPSTFDTVQKSFQDDTLVDAMQLMDDSNGRNTFGGCYATALGSICHEIGHIFDLGHTNDGIMGNDIDYVNRMFTIDKYPRDLPRRMASKCSSTADQTLSVSNRRLTSVKKSNTILLNYHSRRNDDLTFLPENCAVLLNYHKWFNQHEEIVSWIRCNFEQRQIESLLPLALVEFRSADNGLCIKYYRFDVSINSFTVPVDVIGQKYDLIAIDIRGTIRKCAVNEFR